MRSVSVQAVSSLNWLLQRPYCKRKRGYWYIRLLIDLKHLKQGKQATQGQQPKRSKQTKDDLPGQHWKSGQCGMASSELTSLTPEEACTRGLADPEVTGGDRLDLLARAKTIPSLKSRLVATSVAFTSASASTRTSTIQSTDGRPKKIDEDSDDDGDDSDDDDFESTGSTGTLGPQGSGANRGVRVGGVGGTLKRKRQAVTGKSTPQLQNEGRDDHGNGEVICLDDDEESDDDEEEEEEEDGLQMGKVSVNASMIEAWLHEQKLGLGLSVTGSGQEGQEGQGAQGGRGEIGEMAADIGEGGGSGRAWMVPNDLICTRRRLNIEVDSRIPFQSSLACVHACMYV